MLGLRDEPQQLGPTCRETGYLWRFVAHRNQRKTATEETENDSHILEMSKSESHLRPRKTAEAHYVQPPPPTPPQGAIVIPALTDGFHSHL